MGQVHIVLDLLDLCRKHARETVPHVVTLSDEASRDTLSRPHSLLRFLGTRPRSPSIRNAWSPPEGLAVINAPTGANRSRAVRQVRPRDAPSSRRSEPFEPNSEPITIRPILRPCWKMKLALMQVLERLEHGPVVP